MKKDIATYFITMFIGIAMLMAGLIAYRYVSEKLFDTITQVTTENGLVCYYHKQAIDCNWDKYNHDTKYGQYPYAVDSTSDLKE